MRYRLNFTLYKRGKYWYYRTYTIDGKRTCGKSTGCTVKAKAILFCEELLKTGMLVTSSNMLFKRYATGFFDEGSVWYQDRCSERADGQMPLSYNSLQTMRSILSKHILPYWGNYKLSNIKLTDIKQYRISKLQEGAGVALINQSVSYMKIIFDTARLDNIIIYNPCDGLKPLQNTKEKKDTFSMSEIIQVCQLLAYSFNDKVFFITGLCTGMRASELVAIRRDTIKSDHIQCFDQKIKVKGGQQLVSTKTGAKRFVPLCMKLHEILSSQIRTDGFCFTRNNIKTVNKAIKQLNITDKTVTLHSTRRFFNTYMLSKNIPPVKVAAVMGHSTGVSAMQELYSNWKPDHFPEILEEQEKLLNTILEQL